MSSAIDTWVNQRNSASELKGLGSTIVASAKNSNVNPFLIVAIAQKESSLADPSDYNVSNGNNSFGREATSSQPHFQGANLWYKWSSVKASVDFSAPENQGASGGGDMATYLRQQYGSQLDSNNLTAMIMQYAPPSENDTTKYISDVQSWLGELVSLTTGQASTPDTSAAGDSCGSSSCATSSGGSAILCEAKQYEGIYYQLGGGHGYGNFRQNCPEAATAGASSASTAGSPGPCATDCSGLVSVAVDGAFNQNYNWVVSNTTGEMVGDGAQYWKSIPISAAQPGDIVTTIIPDGHVEIVDHVQGSTVYTFGSHSTGKTTSLISTDATYWTTGAWHWTGPGGNG